MGNNTEYIYGTPTVGIRESDNTQITNYPNAIKVVGHPDIGEVNIGILEVDDDGDMNEISELSQWTTLDEASAARLIEALQKQCRRVFGRKPW